MTRNNLLTLVFNVFLTALIGWHIPTWAETISGTVRDIEGEPVADVLVQFTDEVDPNRTFSDRTDGEGQYEVVIEKITAVQEGTEGQSLSEGFALFQSYPNPFNPSALIPYRLNWETYVRLTIYNVLGQPVRALVDEHQLAGQHQAIWDGRDNWGIGLSAGVYLYRIEADGYIQTRKMVMMDGNVGGNPAREKRKMEKVMPIQGYLNPTPA